MDPGEDLKALRLFLVDAAVTERRCGAGFEVSCVAKRWRGLQKWFEALVLGNDAGHREHEGKSIIVILGIWRGSDVMHSSQALPAALVSTPLPS